MHTLLFTDTANEMQGWMTAIDASIQGSAGKAKERVKKVQLRFEHKKVGIPHTSVTSTHTTHPYSHAWYCMYKTLLVIASLWDACMDTNIVYSEIPYVLKLFADYTFVVGEWY